jgi:hypothetical protein
MEESEFEMKEPTQERELPTEEDPLTQQSVLSVVWFETQRSENICVELETVKNEPNLVEPVTDTTEPWITGDLTDMDPPTIASEFRDVADVIRTKPWMDVEPRIREFPRIEVSLLAINCPWIDRVESMNPEPVTETKLHNRVASLTETEEPTKTGWATDALPHAIIFERTLRLDPVRIAPVVLKQPVPIAEFLTDKDDPPSRLPPTEQNDDTLRFVRTLTDPENRDSLSTLIVLLKTMELETDNALPIFMEPLSDKSLPNKVLSDRDTVWPAIIFCPTDKEPWTKASLLACIMPPTAREFAIDKPPAISDELPIEQLLPVMTDLATVNLSANRVENRTEMVPSQTLFPFTLKPDPATVRSWTETKDPISSLPAMLESPTRNASPETFAELPTKSWPFTDTPLNALSWPFKLVSDATFMFPIIELDPAIVASDPTNVELAIDTVPLTLWLFANKTCFETEHAPPTIMSPWEHNEEPVVIYCPTDDEPFTCKFALNERYPSNNPGPFADSDDPPINCPCTFRPPATEELDPTLSLENPTISFAAERDPLMAQSEPKDTREQVVQGWVMLSLPEKTPRHPETEREPFIQTASDTEHPNDVWSDVRASLEYTKESDPSLDIPWMEIGPLTTTESAAEIEPPTKNASPTEFLPDITAWPMTLITGFEISGFPMQTYLPTLNWFIWTSEVLTERRLSHMAPGRLNLMESLTKKLLPIKEAPLSAFRSPPTTVLEPTDKIVGTITRPSACRDNPGTPDCEAWKLSSLSPKNTCPSEAVEIFHLVSPLTRKVKDELEPGESTVMGPRKVISPSRLTTTQLKLIRMIERIQMANDFLIQSFAYSRMKTQNWKIVFRRQHFSWQSWTYTNAYAAEI